MKIRSLFLDGRTVNAKKALMDSLAPGIVEGEGVFETMRVHDGTIFALGDHLDRLYRGLKLLKIRSPYSKTQWRQYLYGTIQASRLREARVRLSIWKDGRRLRTAIVCQAAGNYSDDKYRKGLKAMVSEIRRKKTRFSNIKSLDYACFLKAFNEAKKRGYDEAILLNNRGELAEGSRTNIFFIKKGTLFTPAIQCGCLNGITRQMVIQCARQMKIPVKAVAADIYQLLKADEAFVTNSVIGVMPLTAVKDKTIGQGKAGPLTRKLLNAYRTNVHLSCRVQGKSV